MSSRLTGEEMVRGLNSGLKTLQTLDRSIRNAGGVPEILSFLTRPRFRENLGKIAKFIADCDWRIPASEMRKRAERIWRDHKIDTADLEEVRNFWWQRVLREIGIPFDEFGGSDNPPIPDLYRRQFLAGRQVTHPIFLDHGGVKGSKVLVDLRTTVDCPPWNLGSIIDATTIEEISVADSRYFDFTK